MMCGKVAARGAFAMIEVFRSGAIILMAITVMSAGVVVLLYG